ncbi:hypothetical protein [Bacillus thuringiensis]|uniref:Uncharacterized protein n=1 Tax=Bacillus thuringiensis TaxID=1428 RepID=A0A9X6ZPQ1_BACTU|nr:hypothetical protein [Bacillus thuringiensis]PFJ29056.1 hypothetical protein COJ15_32855 [Bacillus thuringiensis]
MKHTVSREIGLALDCAIREFTLEEVLDVPKRFNRWNNECEPLNEISTYQLAQYIIEGYTYPKSKEEKIDSFVDWFQNYNEHIPYPTKNSSYRRGRRQVLEEIEKKLVELNLLELETEME